MSPLWVFGFLLVTTTLAVSSDISEKLEDNEYVQFSDSILLPYHFKKTSLHCPAPDVRYPHETQCSLFYECRAVSRFSIKFAYPHLMRCNTGKLFDKEEQKCVEAGQAKCANSGNDQDNQDHGRDHKDKVSAGFGCPFPFGKFADPLNCGRYYQCTCATPHSHQCPEKTMYDERKEECLDENLVRCGHRPGGIEIDDEFEELKERKNLRCPCSFGTFVHPDDCSKYMICIHDVPTVYTCKKNQLFHAQYKKCLPAEEVTCDPRINPDNLKPPVKKTTTTTTTTTTPAPTTTTTTPEPTTTTPEPTTTTPEPTTTTPEPTTTTPEPTTTTPEPTTTEPTTTQAPVTTPAGKVTKPNTPPPHDCDEDDLDCIIDVTGDPKGWFDCPDRFGHFPHAGSEKLFIHCDNWRPFVKKCNLQEKFSPKMLVCVWIGNPGDHVEK